MKIEKYVVILTAENGDKTHLKINVNRGDKMADIRLAEAIKSDNAVLYIFGEKITKQELEQSKIEYKVRICAKDDINILLIDGGKAYGGGTGKAPKIKVLKALVDGFEAEENQRRNEEKNKLEREQISQEEAKRLMDTEQNYIIVDARTQSEFDEGHIAGAILIPEYEISDRAEKELPDKNQLILVYCRSGRRSKIAAQALADLGYTNVKEFGGIITWEYGIVK